MTDPGDTTTTTAAHLRAGTMKTEALRVATTAALHHGAMIGGHIAMITRTVATAIETVTTIVTTAATDATTDDTITMTVALRPPSRPRTLSSSASTLS